MSLLTSLSAYYKLDGNPNVSFGSNNGTNGGGVTYGPGIINQGGVFNGSNAYVTIPASTDFYFGTGDFGVSVWFKRNTLTSGFILGATNSSGSTLSSSITMRMNPSNILQIDIFSGLSYIEIFDTSPITDTNWHNVVFTRSSGVFYLYIDTILKTTTSPGSWLFNASSNNMSIGRGGEYNGLYFSGSIDEVGFWKQSLLSYVSALYNAGVGVSYPFYADPVGPINYLIVGGGGAGGSSNAGVGGGGGGAGGVITGGTSLVLGTYPVVVGSGGITSGNGNNSTFNGLIALGGSRGRSYGDTIVTGGSGGGGAAYSLYTTANPGTPGQGNFGGDSNPVSPYNSGGGGGFSSVGLPYVTNTNGGAGGAGISSSISGTAVFYAGGGGGAAARWGSGSGVGGSGGSGVGGLGGGTYPVNPVGAPGAANTGSGGGGSAAYAGADGGNGSDGVVILSYTTGSVTATGGTITTAGGNTIHTFTTSGNFIIYAGNANFLSMFDN